jgi:hypothetical protein
VGAPSIGFVMNEGLCVCQLGRAMVWVETSIGWLVVLCTLGDDENGLNVTVTGGCGSEKCKNKNMKTWQTQNN